MIRLILNEKIMMVLFPDLPIRKVLMHMNTPFHRRPRAESAPRTRRSCRPLGILLILCASALTTAVRAQDRTVVFGTEDPGESKAITEWGLDTAWNDWNNLRRGAIFMGVDQVDYVRIAFPMDEQLVGGELSANNKAEADDRIANMAWAGLSGKPLTMTADTGSTSSDRGTGVDSWYKNGSSQVYPDRWVQAMEATVDYYASKGKTIVSAAPFNEADYGWDQGTMQNLYDICSMLQTNSTFSSIDIAGGSTLNCGDPPPGNPVAYDWYNYIKSVVDEGTTHQLAGDFDHYVSFYQYVLANSDTAVNEEIHNIGEAIIGAEYGLQRGIFWASAERTRAAFVKACQGDRLGYAEHRPDWTAAAVYRAPGGEVQAFVGESERQALPTTYRFFSTDRDVFYDGHGPMRAYSVTTTGDPIYWSPAHKNAERVVDITYGADVAPPIDSGQYVVVNRYSQKVMEVESGDMADGANIRQNAYNAAYAYQRWDIAPLQATNGGDYSFYSIRAAHSGSAADVWQHSLDPGGDVRQWPYVNGRNQHWVLEYAEEGYFFIRSGWSGKYLEVENGSSAPNANIQQGNGTGATYQQWRLIPVGATPTDFTKPGIVYPVTATANARSVHLNWNASSATDLAGYTVLRSTTTNSSGTPIDFEIVARGLTNTAFTDKSANLPIPYWYTVLAVDKSYNRSGDQLKVSATPTGEAGLVARYTFDGSANDSSVNANDAIIVTGSPNFMASGKYGTAMDLNGSSQYTMLPANMLAGVTDFTIALWVRWEGSSKWQRIWDFGNGPKEYMFLTPRSGDNTLRFAITTDNNGNEEVLETSILSVGAWRHIAVTRSGDTAKLYVDGVVVDSGTITNSPASINPALNNLGDSQFDDDDLFNGQLDELFIYDYALNDAGIINLMNNHQPPPAERTTLSTTIAGDMMNFSWPSNYFGCRLESNAVSLTATGSWFTVSDSATTNKISMPINIGSSNVFFRLAYP